MANHIHQEIVFDARPADIYRALLDPAEFSRLTNGAPTEIEATPGGSFSCFGGMILGRNIECEPGQRIVQAWRVKNWEPGVYSVARFEFIGEGSQTRLVLDHTGFPETQQSHLEEGWHRHYWNPIRESLNNTRTTQA